MAPEALDARVNLQDLQSFKQIDIYAFALIMWEIIWRCALQEGGWAVGMVLELSHWVGPTCIQFVKRFSGCGFGELMLWLVT